MTTQSEMIRWMQAFALGIGLLALGACATGGNRSVYYAAYSGDTKALEALLSSGGDPNELVAGGWTPLMIAAAEGHSRTVNTLIKADAGGSKLAPTALTAAQQQGHIKIVERLKAAGARE